MAEAAHDLYDREGSEENPGSYLNSREFGLQRTKFQGSLKDGDTGNSDSNASNNQTKAANPSQLADQESAASTADHNAQEESGDTLGKGFTNKGDKPGPFSKFRVVSRVKRRVAIIGIVAAASLIGAGLGFLALLPLKVVSLVDGLETHFSATTDSALDQEQDNLFNNYFKKYIGPNLGKSYCHDTTSPNCVSGISGFSPISRLYESWKQNHLETKLANDYGVVFGKQGNTLYMYLDKNVVGKVDNISTFLSSKSTSIFDLPGTIALGTATEARQALDGALKDASLWDKAYFRFKYGALLEEKYGIKLCVIRCIIDDKFSYPLSNKIAAAKAQFALRVISPLSQSFGLEVACLLMGNCQQLTQLPKATPENPDELSSFQQQLQSNLQSLKEDDPDALNDVISKAAQYSKDGFAKTLFSDVVKNITSRITNSPTEVDNAVATEEDAPVAETVEQATSDAIPGVGEVLIAAQIVHTLGSASQAFTMLRYAIVAAAAVSLYSEYQTVSSEIQSGHVDSAEVGSFTNSLGTNLSGSSSDQLDATQAPLYQSISGNGPSSGLPTSSTYKCNDGSTVPSGQLVCPEESLTESNGLLNGISTTVNSIPGLSPTAGIITTVSNIINGGITSLPGVGNAISFVGGVLLFPFKIALSIPPLKNLADAIQSAFASLIGDLIQSPFTNDMNGARTYDMMAAGADVSNNESCRVQLGCAQLTNQQVGEIQTQQLEQAKATFDSQSIFARVFSTSSPYSLVSRLAVAMPTNIATAINDGVASLINDPFGSIGSVFSSIFATDKAFAAVPPQPDPFGVVQYGYTSAEIPADPEDYWDTNCQPQDPGQTDLDTLNNEIEANWENSSAISQDQTTGEPIATEPQACLLILSAVQSGGSLFDSSLAPAGSTTPDPASP